MSKQVFDVFDVPVHVVLADVVRGDREVPDPEREGGDPDGDEQPGSSKPSYVSGRSHFLHLATQATLAESPCPQKAQR